MKQGYYINVHFCKENKKKYISIKSQITEKQKMDVFYSAFDWC